MACQSTTHREPHQQAFQPPTYLRRSLGSVGQDSLVTEDPRDVSPLSRPGTSLVGSYPGVLSITERLLLLPSSHSCCSVGRPCERLSSLHWTWSGENNRVTSFIE